MKSRTHARREFEVTAESNRLAGTVDAVVLSGLALLLSVGLLVAGLATLYGIAQAVAVDSMLKNWVDGILFAGYTVSMGLIMQVKSLSPGLGGMLYVLLSGTAANVGTGSVIFLSVADLPIPVLLVFTVTGGVLLVKAVARIRAILRLRNIATTE